MDKYIIEFPYSWKANLHYWIITIAFIVAGLSTPDQIAQYGFGEIWVHASFTAAIFFYGIILYHRFAHKHIINISDRTISSKHGILWPKMHEVSLDHIRSTSVDKNPIKVILRFGTLNIATAATAEAEIQFINIDNPMKVKSLISQLARKSESNNAQSIVTQ